MLTDEQTANGATVGDWLGTARTSAHVAALHLDDIRTSGADPMGTSMAHAEKALRQALAECAAIRESAAWQVHTGATPPSMGG